MNERIIICGGRDFDNRELCFEKLNEILSNCDRYEFVLGRAKGADKVGEEYAESHSIKTVIFKANWNRYGRAAGPIRNKEMLKYALEGNPIVIAFWDGKSKGTKNMIDQARKAGVKVYIISY